MNNFVWLPFLTQKLFKVPIDLIFALIVLFFLLAIHGVLRLLHVPGRYIAWTIGAFLIIISAIACIVGFLQSDTVLSNSGLLGLIAFSITIYAVSQWLTRHLYLWIKKRTQTFLARSTQSVLIFLRKYHQLFGRLVLITATGHALSYGPNFGRIPRGDLITGIVVWIVLALLVGLGYKFELTIAQKQNPKKLRLLHIGVAAIFVTFLIFHI